MWMCSTLLREGRDSFNISSYAVPVIMRSAKNKGPCTVLARKAQNAIFAFASHCNYFPSPHNHTVEKWNRSWHMKHGFVAEQNQTRNRHEQIFSHSFSTKHSTVNSVWFRWLQNLKLTALQFQALPDDFPHCRLRNASSPISTSCRLPRSPHYRL
jgi:hypothetical protein